MLTAVDADGMPGYHGWDTSTSTSRPASRQGSPGRAVQVDSITTRVESAPMFGA